MGLVESFIAQWDGKYIEADGSSPGSGSYRQCVDLAKAYQSKLGLKITSGNAIKWLDNCDKSQWDVFRKGTGTPTPGSLIVFDKSYGSVGHIALYVDGDSKRFNSFEQNNPKYSKCHIVNHSYNGVVGWMTPKGEKMFTDKEWLDIIWRILHHTWRITHSMAVPDDNSIRADRDYALERYKSNNWIFSDLLDRWKKGE